MRIFALAGAVLLLTVAAAAADCELPDDVEPPWAWALASAS